MSRTAPNVRLTDHAWQQKLREQAGMLLLTIPALLVVTLLLLLPLGWMVWQSFENHGFTLAHYRRILTDASILHSVATTFRIGAVVTALTLLLGYPVAYAATLFPRWRLPILALVVLPFWTSVLVRTYAWLVLLQRTGLVNRTLMASGIIASPVALAYNELGTVIATVHILLPFMVLPLYSAMQAIPHDLVLAGASLGGRPWHVFRRVFLPLSLPGLIAGAVLVFVLTLGFYITPELLGGGRVVMVSSVVSQKVELSTTWGAASALSVVLLAGIFAIFAVAARFVPLDRLLERS